MPEAISSKSFEDDILRELQSLHTEGGTRQVSVFRNILDLELSCLLGEKCDNKTDIGDHLQAISITIQSTLPTQILRNALQYLSKTPPKNLKTLYVASIYPWVWAEVKPYLVERLKLVWNAQASPDLFDTLRDQCTLLESLSIGVQDGSVYDSCSAESFHRFLDVCQLKSLTITGTQLLSTETIYRIALNRTITHLQLITKWKLDLATAKDVAERVDEPFLMLKSLTVKIGSEALQLLLPKMKRLSELTLTISRDFTAKDLEHISKLSELRSLVVLVRKHNKIMAKHIVKFVKKHPQLTRLEFIDSLKSRATNSDMESIAKSLPQVKRIDLGGSGFLTMASLLSYSGHCKNLEYLVIDGMLHPNDYPQDLIFNRLQFLYINGHNCNDGSRPRLELPVVASTIIRSIPNLKELDWYFDRGDDRDDNGGDYTINGLKFSVNPVPKTCSMLLKARVLHEKPLA